MPTFQEELLAKQKKIMDGVQYKSGIDAFRFGPNKGQSIQEELVEAVLKIAEGIPGAEVIQPPGVKTYARASAKVVKEYGGDWAKMKDLNRCTLVVPARDGVKAAVDLVKDQFMVVRHSIRLQYLSGGMTDPLNKVKNPCGYSGGTIFLKTAGTNNKKGEIQVNYPDMMYAKSLPEFAATLGQSQVAAMWVKFAPVPGGLGHKMYEVWQAQEQTPVGKGAAAACKMYYDYFRSEVRGSRQGHEVLDALRKLNLPGVVLPRPVRI